MHFPFKEGGFMLKPVSNENKPRIKRNPRKVSEPINVRNPIFRSEPLGERNPVSKSEPYRKSNPIKKSEPQLERKPSDISEPLGSSNPAEQSEPQQRSQPFKASEPMRKSQPFMISEPQVNSNPKVASEPAPKSQRTVVSEPSEERKPACFSDWRGRVRLLVEVYYDTQEVRIRSFNRLRQMGTVEGVNPNHLKLLEQEIRQYIQAQIKGYPITVYLRGIRGIGPILAGGLISYFDVHKAKHVSSFWKYAGLAVEDGKAVKRRHGEKTDYNPLVKVLMWKVADSFLKQRTPVYRDIYDEVRLNENKKLNNPLGNPKNCPQYSECLKKLKKAKTPSCKMHIHRRACRIMVKRFLSDLWLNWRKLEGLPITEPYVIGVLGHSKLTEA